MLSLRTLGRQLAPKANTPLRRWLKRAYAGLSDPFDRGCLVPLNIGLSLRVPAYYANAAWTGYEEAGMRACLVWLQQHPAGMLADVGCSIAIYSLLALQVSPRSRVFAFDSDRISLKTTAEFCRFADTRRLGLVHGFLTDQHTSGATLATALTATAAVLAAPDLRAEPTEVRFLCLDRPLPAEVIPRHSLDGLLAPAIPAGTPLLIKIDVEGAELIVLRGASQLLRQHQPTLLLSVHPQFLPSFQQSSADVAAFLQDHDYGWTVLNTDHEEHWWCEPGTAAAPPARESIRS